MSPLCTRTGKDADMDAVMDNDMDTDTDMNTLGYHITIISIIHTKSPNYPKAYVPVIIHVIHQSFFLF